MGLFLLAIMGVLCAPLATGDLFGARAAVIDDRGAINDVPARFSSTDKTDRSAAAVSALQVVIDLADGPGEGFDAAAHGGSRTISIRLPAIVLPAARIAADRQFAYGPRAPPSA